MALVQKFVVQLQKRGLSVHNRCILHSDANCFYASVEMILNPELRGKAVAVCGSTEERHGIVLAKSELAKKAGVKTGQANWEARQACPGLIVVPPHYDQYCKFSRLLRNIYLRYTNLVEPYGMDECWLDVTDSARIKGSGEQIAEEIRKTVKDELGITVSIGVSFNKIFAKLGSDMKKPDAVTILDDSNWRERIWPIPVSELLYVGRSTTPKLMERCVYTIGDLAKTDPSILTSWFGKNGMGLWIFANGEDGSRVMPDGYEAPIKSVGHGITCSCDLYKNEEVWKVMLELTQDIGHRLREYHLCAKGVKLYIRENELDGMMHQMQLPYPSQSPMEIAQAGRVLLEKWYHWQKPVRAVCVTAINLVPEERPVQLDMFGDETARMKRQKLENCVAESRYRFGKRSIFAASFMGDLHMPGDGRHEVTMPGMMYT